MKLSTICTTALCAALTFSALSAGAVSNPPPVTNKKIYVGERCLSWNGGTPGYDDGAIVNTGGGVFTPTLYLDCPIDHDLFEGQTLTSGITAASFTAINYSPSFSVTCALLGFTTSGATGIAGYVGASKSTTVANAWTTVSLPATGNLGSASDAYGWYMTCQIPPPDSSTLTGEHAMILNYSVTETGGLD